MTAPALPPSGSTSWYSWATAVDNNALRGGLPARAAGTTAVSAALPFVNVKDFGALGDGTTDDTAAVSAAVTALATGGTLWFPPGNYVTSSAVSIAKSISVRGASSASTSVINKTGGAGLFTCASDRVKFHDIYFQNQGSISATTTAQATAITYTSGDRGVIEHCYFAGWWNSADFQNCATWIVRDNFFSRAVNYNVHIQNIATPDSGDQVLSGNTFQVGGTYATAAHIRQKSGGGLKVVGNKILNGAIGLDLAVADGIATSILVVEANSFEYQSTTAIRVAQAGPLNTGSFQKVLLHGNQVSGNNCTGPVLDLGGAAAGISSVHVTDNTISGTAGSTSFIATKNIDDLHVDGNQCINGTAGITVASTCTNVFIGAGNKLQGITTPVANSSTSIAQTNLYSGLVLSPAAGQTAAVMFINSLLGAAFTIQSNNGNALFAGGVKVGGSYQNTASLLVAGTNASPAAIVRGGGGTVDLLQLTDSGTTVRWRIDQYGHQVADGNGSPTVAAGAAAGTSPTVSIGSGGSDMAGTLNVTVGTAPTTGALSVVTFHDAYAASPRAVKLMPLNAVTAALVTTTYIGAKSATSWQINLASTPGAGASLSWMYEVVG